MADQLKEFFDALDVAQIEGFIPDKREETIDLEFKQKSDPNTAELHKDDKPFFHKSPSRR